MGIFFLHPQNIHHYPDLKNDVEVLQVMLGEEYAGSLLTAIPEGSTVIPRYRAVSFGVELEQDVEALGSRLINTYQEHRRIADLFSWIHLLEGWTAPAYCIDDIPYLPEGEWFVKGATNSKKMQWFEACYAPTTGDLMRVVEQNLQDSMIGLQDIVIRPFQQFRQLTTDTIGRPVFHERRVFVYQGEILSWGDYWSSHPAILKTRAFDEAKFHQTSHTVVDMTADVAPFYVIDLAEYPDGSWGVVELNDGSMSGLSENDPALLWGRLAARLQ